MDVRSCECCKKRKCNKIYRLPVGSPTRVILRVCGRCVTYNARATRAWLDEQEKKYT